MSTFTKLQPQDGEIIMHCGHVDVKPHHFFTFPAPLRFNRPDGTGIQSKWIALCPKCFAEYVDDPSLAIRGDGRWIGSEPELRNNLQ